MGIKSVEIERNVEDNDIRNACGVVAYFKKGQEVIFNKKGIIFPGLRKYRERKNDFTKVMISQCSIGKQLKLIYVSFYGSREVFVSPENIIRIKVVS